MPAALPFLLAASLVLALASGSRANWTTQAEGAEERKRQEAAGAPPPAVQGASGPSYWFFWWVWPHSGGRTSHGPVYMSDYDAWQFEFRTRSQNLGVQMQRWVWTGSRWLLDERQDPAFMASQPIPGYSVGALPVSPPVRGRWTAPGFPETVTLDGRVFRRSAWQWPRKGVVSQYREDVRTGSRHLFVLEDGTFIIDHVDEENPDLGNPLAHFIADVVKRPVA